MLDQLFESVFDDVYTYVKQNLTPKMEVLECNVITQVCKLSLTLSFGVQKKKKKPVKLVNAVLFLKKLKF